MIAACYIVHYGREWISWSMRSVRNIVDEIFVFYTANPSHGHGTDLKNPETREELYEITKPFSPVWHDAKGYIHEGEHRTFAVISCQNAGADTVLVVDSDEIWPQETLYRAIEASKIHPARSFRIGMRHFWRSLKWVCDDSAMPTRIIKPRIPESFGEQYLGTRIDIGENVGLVFHMGYAQSPAIIRYKQSIHGHKAEWRDGWFKDKFMGWKPGDKDVHPTNVNYWNPQPYIDDGTLDYLVGDHPYFDKDIIE